MSIHRAVTWQKIGPVAVAALSLLFVGSPFAVSGAHAAAGTTVTNASELKVALQSAVPGAVITLQDGRYVGKFEAGPAGLPGAPITLVGSRDAILTTGSTSSGYGLHVTGSYWNLIGFTVSTAKKGIVLDESVGSVIDGVDVGHTGDEAIHIRTNSTDVVVKNSFIHDTGEITPAYGEGVYVGSANSNWASIMGSSATPDRSDRVTITRNRFENISAEGIDIKEGTRGGRISFNSFSRSGFSGANSADSWVDVKGNGYAVADNWGDDALLDAFQVHSVVPGWGGSNRFARNHVAGVVPGFEVNIASKTSGNVVYCETSSAIRGLTNVLCS